MTYILAYFILLYMTLSVNCKNNAYDYIVIVVVSIVTLSDYMVINSLEYNNIESANDRIHADFASKFRYGPEYTARYRS